MTINKAEIEKFDTIAKRYWDLNGPMRMLHKMNHLRIDLVEEHVQLFGKRVLDVGTGGGLAAESFAERGANVTGIDASEKMLRTAQLHSEKSKLNIDYRHMTAEDLASQLAGYFDLITCFEMLEHVPKPFETIESLAKLLKPNGFLIISTINRTIASYIGSILIAEKLLDWVPMGTHDYSNFIKPSELVRSFRHHRCQLRTIEGVNFNPFTESFSRSKTKISINYIAVAISTRL